jgi:hypothetical protein
MNLPFTCKWIRYEGIGLDWIQLAHDMNDITNMIINF